jgi:hypothetical protein
MRYQTLYQVDKHLTAGGNDLRQARTADAVDAFTGMLSWENTGKEC